MVIPVCRLLPFEVGHGPFNMALDEALLETAAAAGVASLRFYAWAKPTLSLGYFQPAALRLNDPLLCGLPYVRRPSGGDALVHHRELTYALALPAGPQYLKSGESWIQRMHGIICSSLRTFGVSLRGCGNGERQQLGPFLCFLHQTPCDLLIGSHKVVGSAQRKAHGALLQHGAILLAQSPHTPALPGLHELAAWPLDAQAHDRLLATLMETFARETGWRLEPCDPTPDRERAAELVSEKYTSTRWNDKR
jgi:lipoate-protein ligase A